MPLSRLIPRQPDLWGTVDGAPIGLYDPVIRYHAANEPLMLLGRRDVAAVMTSYPDTYTLTFTLDKWYDKVKLLESADARLMVNDIVFSIDSAQPDGDIIRYQATGWPRQTASTISQDLTPQFPGWEGVGHEYLDDYDYEA